MVVTTTTTLTLGLALHKVTDGPFARTFAATRGPDVVAELVPGPDAGTARATGPFAALLHARGVVGTSGPYPVAFLRLTAAASTFRRRREGRDAAPAAIDQPLLTAGRWVSPGQARDRARPSPTRSASTSATTIHARTAGRFAVAGIAVSTAAVLLPGEHSRA